MSARIRATILRLLDQRQPGATICPSEAARVLWPGEWRRHMNEVRETAARMARIGELEICQGGSVVDPAAIRGPVRLGRRGLSGRGDL
ncbi:MAG: DUF3253 domain-containing protein [Akkermansiaceae bacterium]|nr:DUF3253 domain-containing protein [Akkermansiaceae bacterium]